MLANHVDSGPWSSLWRGFLPAAALANPARLRQARRLVLFSLTIQFWLFLFLLFFVSVGARGCQITAALLIVAIFANLLAFRGGMSASRGAQALCGLGWSCCIVFALLTGGIGSAPTIWFITVSLVAVLLLDMTWGAFWTLAGAAALAGLLIAQQLGFEFPNELSAGQSAALHFVGLQGALLTSYGFVYLLLRPYRDAVRNIELLDEQLSGIERDLASSKAARDFSLADWIGLDERRRQLEQQLQAAKKARRHLRPL